MPQNPRKIALDALLRVDSDGGYSNIVIDKALHSSDLDGRDRAFVSALFYGVLERRVTLDHVISKYSKTPLRKLSPTVLEALRLAVYQLFFMDRIPESAAVDQSVRLVKKSRDFRFLGFVNGVLRNIIRDGKEKALLCDGDRIKKLSVKYSASQWLITHLSDSYGFEITNGFFGESFGRPPVSIRVNTTKITESDLAILLEKKGIEIKKSPICENVLELSGAGEIDSLDEYGQGFFHAQDSASALCCEALDPKPGERILDVCAAPGGKSFTLAEIMENTGEVVSLDLYEHKVGLIKSGAERLGLTCIKAAKNDASVFCGQLGRFDRVLCDLPCSGFGIVRRKPEIRYKTDTNVDILPDLQYRILCQSANYLKTGGIMVYSTCTLNPAENGENSRRFLETHPEFEPCTILKQIPRAIEEPENNITLFTHINHTDGFFISAFRKVRDGEN